MISLAVLLKGTIEIRRLCFKLGAARIYHFKYPGNAQRFSFLINIFIGTSIFHDSCYLLIAKTKMFCFFQKLIRQCFQSDFCKLFFTITYFLNLVNKPAVNAGSIRKCVLHLRLSLKHLLSGKCDPILVF